MYYLQDGVLTQVTDGDMGPVLALSTSLVVNMPRLSIVLLSISMAESVPTCQHSRRYVKLRHGTKKTYLIGFYLPSLHLPWLIYLGLKMKLLVQLFVDGAEVDFETMCELGLIYKLSEGYVLTSKGQPYLN